MLKVEHNVDEVDLSRKKNENKVSKTSTLALEQQSNHLIEVKNRIAEIVVTDEEQRKSHITRLLFIEVVQFEDDDE